MLMLHNSIDDNGEMKTAMVKDIPVKPGGSITFGPGGFHLMCMKSNDEAPRARRHPRLTQQQRLAQVSKRSPAGDLLTA